MFQDCHVLTFTSGGSVAEHLVLHPQLEIGNFIIRAIWLPGAQTQLALVTADFVKIYDLSTDVLSPQYYFLVPTGKIRDATFMSAQVRVDLMVYFELREMMHSFIPSECYLNLLSFFRTALQQCFSCRQLATSILKTCMKIARPNTVHFMLLALWSCFILS